MDPTMLGLLGLTGLSDPTSFATAMSGMGMAPPLMGPGGAQSFPSLFGLGQDQGLGETLTGWDPTVTPAAGPSMLGGPQAVAQNLAKMGLQGVKAPEPVKPIMAGGVAGGVKPPDAGIGNKVSNNLGDAILALISRGRQAGPMVPSLGALLKGAA